MCVSGAHKDQNNDVGSPGTGVIWGAIWYAMWMLATEPKSSTVSSSVHYCSVISSTSIFFPFLIGEIEWLLSPESLLSLFPKRSGLQMLQSYRPSLLHRGRRSELRCPCLHGRHYQVNPHPNLSFLLYSFGLTLF